MRAATTGAETPRGRHTQSPHRQTRIAFRARPHHHGGVPRAGPATGSSGAHAARQRLRWSRWGDELRSWPSLGVCPSQATAPATRDPPGRRTPGQTGRSVMNEEHDGMDQGNPSEEEYQRVPQDDGRHGPRGHSPDGRASDGEDRGEPPRHRGPVRQGAGVRRDGGAPPGGGGLRQGHRPGPRQRGRPPRQGARLWQAGGAPPGGGGLRRRHPPGPRRRRGALQPGGVQGGAGRPCGGDERLRRGRRPGPRRRPLQPGIDPGGDGQAPPGGEGPEQGP